ALRAPADLRPRRGIEQVPGHGVGEAGAGLRGRFRSFEGDGKREFGEGPGEGLVEPAVAPGRRRGGGGATGGKGQEEGEVPAVFDETASGVTPHRQPSTLVPLRRLEVTTRARGLVPGVEPSRREARRDRPLEEGLVEGHVGRGG